MNFNPLLGWLYLGVMVSAGVVIEPALLISRATRRALERLRHWRTRRAVIRRVRQIRRAKRARRMAIHNGTAQVLCDQTLRSSRMPKALGLRPGARP